MSLSQCLDDSLIYTPSRREDNANIKELYNETHRLALEELVAGGVDSYWNFLRKEKIANFLSEGEIYSITRSAVIPRCVSLNGDDALEQSLSSSVDCSTVTYFPEVSDVEPPLLEIGWPAFTKGSFRGVTRAIAHFQPSYGECIYSCKETARKMIKSAKEVIAIVTDSLTDLDIFRDLQEACTQRRVPVYILLEKSCVPAFLQMCSTLRVRLEELQQMRVRSITGGTYFMRSGAKITGKVHERFMLIDGSRVATGSYRFNWTDGKLNSSNLIELSGQITENFDEEFRILYAQSMPLYRTQHSERNNGLYDPLVVKQPPSCPSQMPKLTNPEAVCLTSTPSRAQAPRVLLQGKVADDKMSDSSTIGEEWMDQGLTQDVLASDAASRLLIANPASVPTEGAVLPSCHMFTQTSCTTVDGSVQTDLELFPQKTDLPNPTTSTTSSPIINSENKGDSLSSGSDSTKPGQSLTPRETNSPPPVGHHAVRPNGNVRECFQKLTKDRQYHYSTIRSKLDNMVTLLSHRRELVDLTNLALGPGVYRGCRAQTEQMPNPGLLMENVLMGAWARSRCLQ